jgi:hypothetical protein
VQPSFGRPPGGILATGPHPDHHDLGVFDAHALLLTIRCRL